MDQQKCEVKFESFGHSSNQFILKWKTKNESNINPNINLAQFSVSVTLKDGYSTPDFDVSYPGLSILITLKREVNFKTRMIEHLVNVPRLVITFFKPFYLQQYLFFLLGFLCSLTQSPYLAGRTPSYAYSVLIVYKQVWH